MIRFLILLLVSMPTLCQQLLADSQCVRVLKIGVSLPLSAGATASGEAVRNSMILAKERYDKGNCVQFLFEDDQLLPKNTLNVVTKFITIDKVDGIVVYGTPTSLAVGELVDKKKVPMVALSILGKVVEGRSHIVKHWCTAETLNDAVVREVSRRGYKRVAIVSTTNDAMLGLRDQFLSAHPVEVPINEQFLRDDFEFATLVSKIIAAQVDAVYVLLFPPQTGAFVKKLRQGGYKGEAFGVHNIEDPHEVAASGGAMLGMWLANGDGSAGENYEIEYQEKFKSKTVLGGASGFDVAKMFIEASQGLEDLNQFLHGLKGFSGAFGRYGATGKNDFDLPAVIKVVASNGFPKVEPLHSK